MSMKTIRSLFPAFMIVLIAILACNMPNGAGGTQPSLGQEPVTRPLEQPITAETSTVAITHTTMPSNSPPAGKLVYDVDSSGTAAEQRAPYGDSYNINRLERPFLQGMTYVPDLDIVSYTVSSDSSFWYVSIELIGAYPNNMLGIDYGVELDLDRDGFGDYVIWAHSPYTTTWDTTNVQVFQDKNHDTGGRSGEKSDAPITTNGYETLIFNGGNGDADLDMAWVRVNAGPQATVQFAFKKSWAGSVFMLGVLADAGLKHVGKLDYVDRFTEAEAGSPVKDKQYYPLRALFAVDNACREAFGFNPTGYEPQLCPRGEAQPKPKGTSSGPTGCQPPPGGCSPDAPNWWPAPHCACSSTPYNP